MSGVNKVILVGRLGKDPELKYLPNGNAACKFSVATSESWTDKGGQKQEKTEWHNIVVWSKLAEIANQYLQKGSQVYLEGKIQTDSWEDSSGNKRYSTSVIASSLQFLGGKTEGKPANKAPTTSSAFPDESRTFVSEDIPF